FGEGVVISCFCVHFSLIAYSLSSAAFSFPAAVAIRNHDSFDVDNPFDSIFVCMNLLVLVWNMLLDSFPYLDYLKLDHCYLLPISLPELFVSSHGGTMTMSLMHQWHDTICGGVISLRRSLLERMDDPSPYRTRKTVSMIGNPEEIHNAKALEDKRDMDVGWDITSKDVERMRQSLTPTIHTLPNLEPVVQPYIPLGPVHDKDKIVREKEQDYDIPLNDSVMQPLTPQTVYITPPDNNYVALATNPMSNKQLNKLKEEC
ncbi:hypothetical protein Tco_0739762, partial [Tanacetum coccineum]